MIKRKPHTNLLSSGLLAVAIGMAACSSPSGSTSSTAAPAQDAHVPAAATPELVCNDDIDKTQLSAEEQKLMDTLWQQTIQYLDGFNSALKASSLCHDTARAIVQTNNGTKDGLETRCVTRYRDVQLMVKHIDWVLANPNKARRCFDAQKNYEAFPLYAPSDEMKAASEVASWVDRPTLNEYYDDFEGQLAASGKDLAKNFEAILMNTSSMEFAGTDMTYRALPDLWTAVGWLPFYSKAEKAINEKFRGGYAYAEVMGPWGLLRIKEINGESVGAEVGMTIQVESFYPYHFHHSQELYMNIGKPACPGQNSFMVMNWDNPAFEQTRTEKGWDVIVDKSRHPDATWFRPTSPSDKREWIAYYERSAIHATNVGGECGKGDAPAGFAQVWARTSARDNNQTTQICVPVDEEGNRRQVASVDADDRMVCHIEDFEY